MDAGTGFTAQDYELSPLFLPKEWIMEHWDKNYYISAIPGASNGSSLVVVSTGTQYPQQSYKVSDSFPFKWINKKWKEGFHVTSMATSGSRWAVVVSRGAGFTQPEDYCFRMSWLVLVLGGEKIIYSFVFLGIDFRLLSSISFIRAKAFIGFGTRDTESQPKLQLQTRQHSF